LGALRRVAAAGEARFVSRGDQSGTHWAEQRLWALAGVSPPAGARYRACGCGMGQALNIAAGLGAYTLSDRATWLSFRQQGALAVLVEGDARLRNPYSVIVVHPARHPHVQAVAGQRFVDWLRGSRRAGGDRHFPVAGAVGLSPSRWPVTAVRCQCCCSLR
jgi:tungstate transport system substrate-binding protein